MVVFLLILGRFLPFSSGSGRMRPETFFSPVSLVPGILVGGMVSGMRRRLAPASVSGRFLDCRPSDSVSLCLLRWKMGSASLHTGGGMSLLRSQASIDRASVRPCAFRRYDFQCEERVNSGSHSISQEVLPPVCSRDVPMPRSLS